MGKTLDIFKKQGGFDLIKNYWSNGVLGYAICQFLLLGKSKTALEILRLGVYLKTNNKISKKIKNDLLTFDKKYCREQPPMHKSNKIWIYWSTGLEETAPEIVKRCFRSIKENLKDRDIVLLSKYNYQEYVDIPDYIINKYNKGFIKHVHFADLLRIELLAKYGGTWIDSTVLCLTSEIPSYMLNSDFFLFQQIKPGADGNVIRLSSWFITAYSNHKFVLAQQYLLRNYWKNYDKAIDYFFFHHFFAMISDFYSDDWKKIVQYPNSLPHIIQLMQFEEFNQEKWDAVINICPFHKLTYKVKEEDTKKEGTYYKYIIDN